MAEILRPAGTRDIPELARLNKALADEESYDVARSLDELTERMQRFLVGPYEAYFIVDSGADAGYVLVNSRVEPLYIRQFYVKPQHRKKGVGRRAVEAIIRQYKTDKIDVEVMAWNHLGMKFWQGVGFKHRTNGLRLSVES
jgi:GNAT superfamily N-acetyltransferase